MAIEAIAFIGCTGNGIPNSRPVRIFESPVKISVDGRCIEWPIVMAMSNGSSVPKSPSEPEISAMGRVLSV